MEEQILSADQQIISRSTMELSVPVLACAIVRHDNPIVARTRIDNDGLEIILRRVDCSKYLIVHVRDEQVIMCAKRRWREGTRLRQIRSGNLPLYGDDVVCIGTHQADAIGSFAADKCV